MTAPETEAPAPFDPFELQDTILGDIRDPFPALAAARRDGAMVAGIPVLFDQDGGFDIAPEAPTFTAYSHAAVTTILRDADSFSSSILAEVVGQTIIQMDGGEHRRHRAVISSAFRQKALARWRDELVRVVVDDLIDRFVDDGRAELVRALTFDFPVQVIARILGLPRHDYPRFQRWSIEMLSSLADWERAQAASRALDHYFTGVIADRRREPMDDLISDLCVAECDGHRLRNEEICGFLRLLLPAGIETTYRSSGNLLYALLIHPEQLVAVGADRAVIPQAIEEGLRWEPPILFLLRSAVRDSEVSGMHIPAGAIVNVCVGAANRDESVYEHPDRFDIFRRPRQHVSFGWGPHMCVGMHLARMETTVALNALLDRLPNLRLDHDFEPPFVQGTAFRSPPALHVRFG